MGAIYDHYAERSSLKGDLSPSNEIVEVPVGVLGPRHGSVVVDLVEPGCEPLTWPGTIVMKQEFRDCVPWLVIRIVS